MKGSVAGCFSFQGGALPGMTDMRPGSRPGHGEQGGCAQMVVYVVFLVFAGAVVLALAGVMGSAAGVLDMDWLLGEILRRLPDFLAAWAGGQSC